MKRYLELIFLSVAAAMILGSIWGCWYYCLKFEDVLKLAAADFAVIFFAYKLLTGWLFLNLNIDLETKRQKSENGNDHLVVWVTLEKGSIDSLWLKDIDILISKLNSSSTITEPQRLASIRAMGAQKKHALNEQVDWDGEPYPHYVLSPKEKTTFSAYAVVPRDIVILLEVNVLGTRPFYGLETWRTKTPVQWRASTIVLPGAE